MLKKLMKHEFRATGRVMLPLLLVVLATAVGGNFSIRTLLDTENNVLNVVGTLLLTVFGIAIVGICIVALAMMIYRFYKNLLQDEGYVMMTLPVSLHQHIWSKLLVSMIWYVATAAVIVAAFMVLASGTGFLEQFAESLGEIFEDLRIDPNAVHIVPIGIELVLLVFFGGAGACLQFYAAMAIGHSFSNHKLALSAAVYFGMRFVMQLISGILMAVASGAQLFPAIENWMSEMSSVAVVHAALMVQIVFAVIVSAIFYFLTNYFMGKRLNLE